MRSLNGTFPIRYGAWLLLGAACSGNPDAIQGDSDGASQTGGHSERSSAGTTTIATGIGTQSGGTAPTNFEAGGSAAVPVTNDGGVNNASGGLATLDAGGSFGVGAGPAALGGTSSASRGGAITGKASGGAGGKAVGSGGARDASGGAANGGTGVASGGSSNGNASGGANTGKGGSSAIGLGGSTAPSTGGVTVGNNSGGNATGVAGKANGGSTSLPSGGAPGTGGASSCEPACTLGDRRCSGSGIQTCTTDARGCLKWAAATPCPGAQVCTGPAPGAACACPSAPLACGTTRTSYCADSQTVTPCTTDVAGCPVLGTASTCPKGTQCVESAQAASCECLPTPADCLVLGIFVEGAFCTDAGNLATCGRDDNGCPAVISEAECAPPRQCGGIRPLASCTCPTLSACK